MKVSNQFLSLGLAVFFLASCSSNEDNTPEVDFTKISANKSVVFTSEPISITLEGTGYTESSITSNNSKIKITKITNTVYEVSCLENINGKIYAELKNSKYTKTKSLDVSFAEHGVKDFKTVEGITPKIDPIGKALTLLGEPDLKTLSSSGAYEIWAYASKGLSFVYNKSTNIVSQVSIFSSNFYITLEGSIKVNYTNYPYELGNGWKMNNSNTTMDAVVAALGTPTEKIGSTDPNSTLRTYRYTPQSLFFSFYGATVDDYTGKYIKSMIIY